VAGPGEGRSPGPKRLPRRGRPAYAGATRRQRAPGPWIDLGVLDRCLHVFSGENRIVIDDFGGALPAAEAGDDVDRDIGSAQHGIGRGLVDQRLHLFETPEAFVNAAMDFG